MFTAKWEEIKEGKVSDVYFQRACEIIRKKGIDKKVKVEVRVDSISYDWAVFCGLEEVLHLVKGLPVNLWAMEEGSIFHEGEPVIIIEGKYSDFGVLETAILGFICQSSGIATRASRCKKAAGNRTVLSFGARRMHPAISPMIERSAFIGGCDGVSVIKSAEVIGERPVGTMPHALILLVGDETKAFKFFHEVMGKEILRIALVDTMGDEKFTALRASEALGENLYGVRLDTPASRRGDLKRIAEEVRWELDLRGFRKVKIFVSGGIDEDEIIRLNEFVDGYGVGTTISSAQVIDFSLDIVEIEGVPVAKKGKKSGAKQVWRCSNCFSSRILPWNISGGKCEKCNGKEFPLLKLMVEEGKLKYSLPSPQEIRKKVLKQLENVSL